MTEVIKGVCVFYNDLAGFGFLRCINPAMAQDVFLHFSEVPAANRRGLKTGDLVQFSLGSFNGRVVATNVRVIPKEKSPEIAPAVLQGALSGESN